MNNNESIFERSQKRESYIDNKSIESMYATKTLLQFMDSNHLIPVHVIPNKELNPEKSELSNKAQQPDQKNIVQNNQLQDTIELELSIEDVIHTIITDNQLDDFIKIKDVRLFGSSEPSQDDFGNNLDVLVEYDGNFKEDVLTQIFAEQNLSYNGIKIDISPIRKEESGTLETLLPKNMEYEGKKKWVRDTVSVTYQEPESRPFHAYLSEPVTFLEDKKQKTFDTGTRPIWFSTNKDYCHWLISNKETKGLIRTYECEIDLKNPVSIGNVDGFAVATENQENFVGARENLEHLARAIGVDYEEIATLSRSLFARYIWQITNSEQFKQLAISKGYDGIIASERFPSSAEGKNAVTTYGVFDASSIKILGRSVKQADANIRWMRQPSGTVYGWVKDGEIYLTEKGLNPNTPIHEYAHLWGEYVKNLNPSLWQSVKDAMKATPVWDEVKSSTGYEDIRNNEDAVVEEALARYSGRKGASRLIDLERELLCSKNKMDFKSSIQIGALARLRLMLDKFWKWVGSELLHMSRFSSADEVADRVLYDLLHNTDIRLTKPSQTQRMAFVGETGILSELYAEKSDRLQELSIAKEMESSFLDKGKSYKLTDEQALQIKMATGWERGIDHKWRYELCDGTIDSETLEDISHSEKKEVKLSNIYSFPEVYAMYLDFKDLRVSFKSLNQNLFGRVKDNVIYINDSIFEKPQAEIKRSLLSYLAHEVQHLIQYKEGFSQGCPGNNPLVAVTARYKAESDAIRILGYKRSEIGDFDDYFCNLRYISDKEGITLPVYKRLTPPYRENFTNPEDYFNADEEYRSRCRRYMQGEEYMSQLEYKLCCSKIKDQEMLNCFQGATAAFEKYINVQKKTEELYSTGKYNAYRQSSGEVESRNVQERLSMTDDERRKTLAKATEDVSWESQIDTSFRWEGADLYVEQEEKDYVSLLSSNHIHIGNKSLTISDDSKGYIKNQSESLPQVSPWPKDFPDAAINTTQNYINVHFGDDFERAKHGDYEAAEKIVGQCVKDKTTDWILKNFPSAVIAFPYVSGNGNQLPYAYAHYLNDRGMTLAPKIECSMSPHHTGANDLERIFHRSRFCGPVLKGKDYILIDDRISSGATLRDLRDYIVSHGGNVVALSALTASFGGTTIVQTDEIRLRLDKLHITDKQLCAYGIAHTRENLTNAEAARLVRVATILKVKVSAKKRSERPEYKVIVAGCKGFDNYSLLSSKLTYYLQDKSKTHNVTLVSGKPKEEDPFVEKYAEEHGLKCEYHPSDTNSYGKNAVSICNAEMAAVADALIVFSDNKSKEIADLIRISKDKGIPSAVVNVNEVVSTDWWSNKSDSEIKKKLDYCLFKSGDLLHPELMNEGKEEAKDALLESIKKYGEYSLTKGSVEWNLAIKEMNLGSTINEIGAIHKTNDLSPIYFIYKDDILKSIMEANYIDKNLSQLKEHQTLPSLDENLEITELEDEEHEQSFGWRR